MTSSNGDIFRVSGHLINSPHKGQWRGALMFSLICVRINDWVNNREADDLRRYRAHCDVIVMKRSVKSVRKTYRERPPSFNSEHMKYLKQLSRPQLFYPTNTNHTSIFCSRPRVALYYSSHWGRDKIDAILQTTFSNAISWMKMFEFRLKFHWGL